MKDKIKRIMNNKVKKILITLNIIIIFGILEFYICRLIHFYRIENPKVNSDISLADYITLGKNIAVSGSGLYQKDDKYVFIGNDVNNYLYYSGILWRIIEINDDSIKLIAEDIQTSIFWGSDLNYSNSYIRKWLNLDTNAIYSGIFYQNLNNPELYLNKSDFCYGKVLDARYNCEERQSDYIGLLTINEYERARGKDSYLNIGSYFWTINTSEDNIWYVLDTGELNDNAFTEQNYYSYGVRPVINLKKDIKFISGDGSLDYPYIIDKNYSNLLSSKRVGEYINYSGYKFRIIENDKSNVKVALDGFITANSENLLLNFSDYNPNFNIYDGIGFYLNNDFYNSLTNKDYIVNSKWYNGVYTNDYASVYNSYVDANIGLLKVGDFYINDYQNYYLLNRNNIEDLTVYKAVEGNKLYADLISTGAFIRPALVLRGDVIVTNGQGTKNNPYIIGG
ncbi:MAG: hypothetical protein HFI87_06035 [Bacilli bacterium]|nr:hypothetical protein [Bacilli bacterium]